MEKRGSLRTLCAGMGLCCILSAMSSLPTDASSAKQTRSFASPTHQLIVQLKPNNGLVNPTEIDVATLLSQWSVAANTSLGFVRNMGDGMLVVQVSGEPNEAATRLNAQADALGIAHAEPDVVFLPDDAAKTPDDPIFAEQWNLQDAPNATYGIHLPGAWAVTTGTTKIVIAVLDTGVLFTHPDLKHRLLPGYDFITDPTRANDGGGRDADATDPGNWVTKAEATSNYAGCYETNSGWHGTQMAGIIGAEANNQYGISGINWASPLLPVRVLGKCGGHLSDLVDGVRWAGGLPVLDVPPNLHPARVINLSLGAPDVCSPLLQNAINAVTQHGAIVVVSAGNRAFNALYQTPANCNNVLVVGGTDQRGERGTYSNYGGSVHISAPGGDPANASADRIAVTNNLGSTQAHTHTVGWVLGTSPAAAQVSGVVSLMLAQQPSLTLKEIIFLLGKTATPFPTNSSCSLMGCGRGVVNASGAVSQTAKATYTELFFPLFPIQSGSGPNQIRNGGFEAQTEGWAVSSLKGSLVIMHDAYLPPDVLAYAGNYAAWLGGVNDEENGIAQTIAIPTPGAALKFRWRLQSAETDCHNDVLTISINNIVVDSIGLCRSKGTSDWPEYTRSLNGFAGQSVVMQLQVKTNGSLSSNLFVDEVRVE